MPPNEDPPSWTPGLSMQRVNDVANMWGCQMPSADHDGNCAVEATMDGTVAAPDTPELCDKVIANDAIIKLRLLAYAHAGSGRFHFDGKGDGPQASKRMATALAASATTFFLWPKLRSSVKFSREMYTVLIVTDALAVGCFVVVGTNAACIGGFGALPGVLCALITATAGGVYRDLLCAQPARIMLSLIHI